MLAEALMKMLIKEDMGIIVANTLIDMMKVRGLKARFVHK